MDNLKLISHVYAKFLFGLMKGETRHVCAPVCVTMLWLAGAIWRKAEVRVKYKN